MNDTPETAVRYEVRNEVAVLTIDFPPVNALGATMKDGLYLRLQTALADAAVKAIVITGANGKFVAGADIREFGKPKRGVELLTLQEVIEAAPKPVVAAIDGYALGGGLELALAAPFRVAAKRAKIGLPEVNLGILPGGGGTQRGTRLMGPEAALDLILSGKTVTAETAKTLGLVDEVVENDVLEAAVEFAREKAMAGGPYPRAVMRTDKVAGTDHRIFADIRAKNASKWRGMVAPFKIVDCIEAAVTLSPEEGLEFEKAAFQVCVDAPSRAAQVHLFFAERAAAKVDDIPAGIAPLLVATVGVIGAGTMGGGIAMSLANAGLPVQLVEAGEAALENGFGKIRSNYANSVKRGSISQEKMDAALARITPSTDYGVLANVDLVIEAAFEDMEVKKTIFGKLDEICKPGAILATNTSALDIDAIAAATRQPENVIGMHFFSPANVMKLVEVVRGRQSSAQAIVTIMDFAKQIEKIPVLARNCVGFIGNRILGVYGREADFLLEEGATPWQIDKALNAFGFPMGIYLMRDMSGLDVSWRVRQYRRATGIIDPKARYAVLGDKICELGRYGQKTGSGYYKYENGKAVPDPFVEELLISIAAEAGIARKAISDEEIVWRILSAMVNEGARILEEGVAQRASDIDVAYIYGYGFPKYRGGPMYWAQNEGLAVILEKVRGYHRTHGALWQPAPLLERLAASGKGWDDTKTGQAA